MTDKMKMEGLANRYARVVTLWGQGRLGYAENGTRMTRRETLPTFAEVAAQPTWYDEFTLPELPERVLVEFKQGNVLVTAYCNDDLGPYTCVPEDHTLVWYVSEAKAADANRSLSQELNEARQLMHKSEREIEANIARIEELQKQNGRLESMCNEKQGKIVELEREIGAINRTSVCRANRAVEVAAERDKAIKECDELKVENDRLQKQCALGWEDAKLLERLFAYGAAEVIQAYLSRKSLAQWLTDRGF